MSTSKTAISPSIMSCPKCNKIYKSRGALDKHIGKCTSGTETISATISELPTPPNPTPTPTPTPTPNNHDDNIIGYSGSKSGSGSGSSPDTNVQAPLPYPEQDALKEQIHAIMSSSEPPKRNEPVRGENILVNTAALDSLMKAFVSELFSHQNKQIYAILDQNSKLVDENKMLLNMVRSVILTNNRSDIHEHGDGSGSGSSSGSGSDDA